MSLSLTQYVNQRLNHALKKTSHHELQSKIHPEINFKRNSVNLFIGRRGSGKSFNVFRELIKLSNLSNHGYHLFVYVTDKTNDPTYMKIKDELKIPVIMIKHNDAEEYLDELIENKKAYEQLYAISNSKVGLQFSEECINEILSALYVNDLSLKHLHTAVLYDDALTLFRKKTGYLYKQLFENRQPKITYFLCIQEPFGIDVSLKRNLDSLWLFGGFGEQTFHSLYPQLSSPVGRGVLLNDYLKLNRREAFIFKFEDEETVIAVISD